MTSNELPQAWEHKNRRQFERSSTLWNATLASGDSLYDCIVMNISANGAGLQLADDAVLATTVVLQFPRFGNFEGHISWQRGRYVGVQFTAEPDSVRGAIGDPVKS